MQSATAKSEYGFYTIQAAIAAVHAQASDANNTDWEQILAWYSLLLHVAPSPVIELNRTVAVAMHHGPEAALVLVEQLLQQKVMQKYHLCYATYAQFLTRVGRKKEARAALEHALTLTKQIPEQRILKRKLARINSHKFLNTCRFYVLPLDYYMKCYFYSRKNTRSMQNESYGDS